MIFFPSTLFITNTDIDPTTYLRPLGHQSLINNPDIFSLEDYSIESVRSIKKFISQTPYQHSTKIVVINNADLLQTEAQNALLKMLEEPGENNYFILTTRHPHQLLPTIISRCHQIRNNSQPNISKSPILSPKPNIKDNLTLTDSLVTTKEATLEYLQNQLQLHHQQLINKPTADLSKKIKAIQKAINMINNNVDSKSALDFFLLS